MCYSMCMSIFKLPLSIAIASMSRGDKNFRLKNKTYGNFNVKKDLSYIVDDSNEHKLDIYSPVENANGITLFCIHGGGYVYGDKMHQDVFVSWFVNKGFTVVVPNYRLAEKFGSISIVDQVKDCIEALKFVEKEKDYYSIPMDGFFLVGDSAGGHICLMIDILSKREDARKYYGLDDMPKLRIDGIALNSTMYDYDEVQLLAKKLLSKKGRRWMFSDKYKDPEFIKMNNPRFYVKDGYRPLPLFASTAYHDYFSSQSYRLNADCEQFGIQIDYLYEASPNKNIGHVYNHFHLDENEGIKCNQRMIEFFLKNSKVAK